jgi:hypothetical protein
MRRHREAFAMIRKPVDQGSSGWMERRAAKSANTRTSPASAATPPARSCSLTIRTAGTADDQHARPAIGERAEPS